MVENNVAPAQRELPGTRPTDIGGLMTPVRITATPVPDRSGWDELEVLLERLDELVAQARVKLDRLRKNSGAI